MILLSSFTIFKAAQPFAVQMEGHLYIPITTEKASPPPRTVRFSETSKETLEDKTLPLNMPQNTVTAGTEEL